MGENRSQKFEKVFDKLSKSKLVHEGILLIESTSGDFSFGKGYGGKELNSPLLMASITKLFTTTCILMLLEQGKLSLEDKIGKYFAASFLDGLHVYHGKEYSSELTIFDLLFQVSGLPDIYDEGKDCAKNRLIKEDFYITFDQQIAWVKRLQPHFAPNSGARAYYADINFDILGEIIEKVSDLTLSEVYQQSIFQPLGLTGTYLAERESDFIPGIYHKNRVIHRPKFVISSRASGGCITSANDLMVFIKAFFGGRLFNSEILDILSKYKRMQASMGPIYYGGGYMQIPLNGLVTLFGGKGELLGHSGSTGSFAFYYPLRDLFFVGDVNQMASAAIPVRLAMRLAMAAK